MAYSQKRLEQIFTKTDGSCHLCSKKLSFSNYGKLQGRGVWEVEHSTPKSEGGTEHLNNLYPACVSCNRSKGSNSTRSTRSKNGIERAPRSAQKKAVIQKENTVVGGAIGVICTALVTTSPVGLVLGAIAGGIAGNSIDTNG